MTSTGKSLTHFETIVGKVESKVFFCQGIGFCCIKSRVIDQVINALKTSEEKHLTFGVATEVIFILPRVTEYLRKSTIRPDTINI